MTTRVVWCTPGDAWLIVLTVHMYCPLSLMFTWWISSAPSLVMLTLSCPTLVIPLLFIPAIQSHSVSFRSHVLDVQCDQYMMSNAPSFLTTSCNAGQGIVTFSRILVGEGGLPLLVAAKDKDGLRVVFFLKDLTKWNNGRILQRALNVWFGWY